MQLTEKEKKELISLIEQHPVVKKIYDEVLSYEEDPTRVFYAEVVNMTKALAKEMSLARSGKMKECNIITSEDRTFERIKDLLVNSNKIFEGISKGKADIDPVAAEAEKRKGSSGVAL